MLRSCLDVTVYCKRVKSIDFTNETFAAFYSPSQNLRFYGLLIKCVLLKVYYFDALIMHIGPKNK